MILPRLAIVLALLLPAGAASAAQLMCEMHNLKGEVSVRTRFTLVDEQMSVTSWTPKLMSDEFTQIEEQVLFYSSKATDGYSGPRTSVVVIRQAGGSDADAWDFPPMTFIVNWGTGTASRFFQGSDGAGVAYDFKNCVRLD